MVAAPETQAAAVAAAAAAATATPSSTGKLSNGVSKVGQQDEQSEQRANGAGAGENGVNDLTVADVPSPSASPADRTAAQQSSQRSHMSNFDPTPAATANLPPPDIARHIPCRFFPLGTCKYGDQCVFSHGFAGVAGSPGVPSTAELHPAPGQEQQQAPQQQEQPQLMYQPEAYPQGMPMYYPGMEHGMEYGYQQPFSPQQGYYPFPPPFGHYQQHYQPGPPPLQAFYQPGPPPPQQQLAAETPVAAPAASPSPALSEQSQQHASSSPEIALSPSTSAAPPFASPSAPQHIPLSPQGYPPFAPFPGQQPEFGFAPQTAPTSPPTALGPDGLPLPIQRQERAPSLHTFFQTGAAQQQQQGVAAATPGAFPKGAPRAPAAARGPRPPMAGMPFAARLKPRYPPGTPKPACSFFESNRCKNRDGCAFQHLLPDGSDARHLGLNWAGVDGRTENLETHGGLPPAWIANPKYTRGGFKGAQNFNGGYSAREPRPRNRFEEEQQRRFEAQAAQQAQGQGQQQQQGQVDAAAPVAEGVEGERPAQALAHPLPAAPHARAQSETRQPFVNGGGMNGRLPAGGAPQLVAAINGLTRRIPPASAPHGNGAASSSASTSNGAPAAAQQAQQQAQRVPSGADFPALASAPLSPALEKSEASSSVAPSAYTAPIAESTSAPVAKVEESNSAVPAASPALAASESSENEFVMVNHSDAAPPSTTPAAPAPLPPPPPRIMGSFASAAARGASIVVPEKPKKVLVAPTPKVAAPVVEGAEGSAKESTASGKKEGVVGGKKGKGGAGGAKRPAQAAQAVKASA